MRGPARFSDASDPASGPVKSETGYVSSLRSQGQLIVGTYEFSRGFTRYGTSARSSDFPRHVESKSAPAATNVIKLRF
jgi:hypothetical protein